MEFSANAFLDVYQGHIDTLNHIWDQRNSAFHVMMHDIFNKVQWVFRGCGHHLYWYILIGQVPERWISEGVQWPTLTLRKSKRNGHILGFNNPSNQPVILYVVALLQYVSYCSTFIVNIVILYLSQFVWRCVASHLVRWSCHSLSIFPYEIWYQHCDTIGQWPSLVYTTVVVDKLSEKYQSFLTNYRVNYCWITTNYCSIIKDYWW